jgi:acetolactate synthase-1/2/3 large subunit
VAGKAAEFAPKAKFIAHLDIDAAEIGKVKAVNWAHVADAKQGLKDLMEWGKTLSFKKSFAPWCAQTAQLRKDHPLNYKKDGEHIQPYAVLEKISDITKGDAIVTTGVGQHQMWAAQYMRHAKARHFLSSGSMGTMGYGLPAAIGAQLANPKALVIDVDGDGSLRMNLGEMETITTYGLPVKVLLLNNEGDGMVRQWQTMYFGKRYFAIDKNLHTMNFQKLAEAVGFSWSKRINKPGDLDATLKDFLSAKGSAFLEVMIDPFAFVFPMVGPGQGYKEMVVGDWITPRANGNGHHAAPAAAKPKAEALPDLF